MQVDLEKRVQQLYTAALPARKTNFNVLLKQHCVDEYKRLTGNSNLQRLASIDDLTKLHLDIYKQLRARMKHVLHHLPAFPCCNSSSPVLTYFYDIWRISC